MQEVLTTEAAARFHAYHSTSSLEGYRLDDNQVLGDTRCAVINSFFVFGGCSQTSQNTRLARPSLADSVGPLFSSR